VYSGTDKGIMITMYVHVTNPRPKQKSTRDTEKGGESGSKATQNRRAKQGSYICTIRRVYITEQKFEMGADERVCEKIK